MTDPDPGSDQRGDDEVDPRFLLANERTFLAWGRTALALMAAGLASTQVLDPFDLPGGRRLLGLPLILLGGVMAWLSHRRSRAIEGALRRGTALPSNVLPALLTGTLVAAAAVGSILAAASGPD